MVHNFFSNAYFDKPYQLFGQVLQNLEVNRLMTNSRLKVILSFTDIIKMISKHKLGKVIHRMSSLNPMKAHGLSPSHEVVSEVIRSNLKGFDLKQGNFLMKTLT